MAQKAEIKKIRFDDIFCKVKFIVEAPDVDPLKRGHLLQLIDFLYKELMQEINGEGLNQKLAKVEMDIEELLREQSVYVKDSRPVVRKERGCFIYDAFRRISV